ncbi:hypothetical protein PRZ48_009527 [Zasmidium cellare]|uniref:Enoyl reductase (ER) domain-containing protein n=1 Tax=Zasmidium cellare TaxID=395010 RepID=A0ABR0ECL9_ZASCE|nr:hypothetical protein PRZ48_009527 [Zasmidium cellare]
MGIDMATNGTQLPEKQKAAQFNPKDQTVSINEIPIPSIKPHEILVKVKSASLCHSDLMLFEPNEQNLTLGTGAPFTMGHEACGTILQLGSDVQGFEPGDNIGWLPIVDCCYDCDGCQVHNLHCENGTPQVQGMSVDGYFQEYVAIHWRNAAKIPAGMDLSTLAPMFCAGCTAFNSVTDTVAELKGSEPAETWVAVVGCGGLGHLGIQYLKAMGYKVIGIDLSPDALEEAKTQGADHVFNPGTEEDYIAQIKQLTGKGVHAAINYTNSVPAYSSNPSLLRTNGVLMVTGIPQKPLQFSAMDISMNRIRVRGSNNGTTPRLRECLEFSGKYGIKPHLTRYRLEEFGEMLGVMREGRGVGRLGVVFD